MSMKELQIGADSPKQEDKQTFEGGATRQGKVPRYDLLSRDAMSQQTSRMEYGEGRHGHDNWKQGGPSFVRTTFNHLIEHAMLFKEEDWSEDHMAAIGANYNILAWYWANKPEMFELLFKGTISGVAPVLEVEPKEVVKEMLCWDNGKLRHNPRDCHAYMRRRGLMDEYCNLPMNHDGPHSFEKERIPAIYCEAYMMEGSQPVHCEHPKGHEGFHSFQYVQHLEGE